MVQTLRILLAVSVMAMFAVGCSHDDNIVVPTDSKPAGNPNKDGTETLGPPSIAIAAGSGFAVGGVGMVGIAPGAADITVDVPVGATVQQAILYWSGGSTADDGGDNTLTVGGTEITGDLIGGEPPTNFFDNYYFTAYRYDITSLGLITDGSNTVTVSGMDFDYSGGSLDENDGVGLLVIYDDGTSADIQVVDGLDLAFYNFDAPLDATVPQTFTFAAESADRVAQMPIMAGSVGVDRPNRISVTTNGPNGDTVFIENVLGNQDPLWDALLLDVTIPAEATELTVELISPSDVPNGASMSWVAGGLAVPVTPPPLYCLGDFVWYDENSNGCQDEGEMGAEGVEVNLWDCDLTGIIQTTTTDEYGLYRFCDLEAGGYVVQFVAPAGYFFCAQYSGDCDEAHDSNAGEDGITDCVTIVDADDFTIDAALCEPPEEGCSLTIGFWKRHSGVGPQEDLVTPLLPITLGSGGGESLVVDTADMAFDILQQHTYGDPDNGITKLYAQLLGAKLNFANGASDGDVADIVSDADAFLAMYSWEDWDDLSMEQQDDVLYWHEMLDDYNNGYIGPGHCDDDGEDEMEEDDD